MQNYIFPFGQMLQRVTQKDRRPKDAFVLGVYASAVHASWVGANGKQKVAALAVASEPEIFWGGENAAEIISKINIPKELGVLKVPNNKNMNGPSAKALDDLFLDPLDLDRSNTWLCDLLPESRLNPSQQKVIEKYYNPLVQKHSLNPVTIPPFRKSELKSASRREEILAELKESKADTLILLGDQPIYWFLRFFDNNYKKLSGFGNTDVTYGKVHEVKIDNKVYKVIALVHPRQAAGLGQHDPGLRERHAKWIKQN